MTKEYIGVKEVAKRLGQKPRTIYE